MLNAFKVLLQGSFGVLVNCTLWQWDAFLEANWDAKVLP